MLKQKTIFNNSLLQFIPLPQFQPIFNPNFFPSQLLDPIISQTQIFLLFRKSYGRVFTHSTYGLALVSCFPGKYYAQKSHHYNHSKQINQSYGFQDDIYDIQSQEQEQENSDHNSQEEKIDDNNDGSNQGQQGQANNESQIHSDENDFIVQDGYVEPEEEDEIDRLQKEAKQMKANRKNKINPQISDQDVKEINFRKNQRQKGSQQCKIAMEDYLLQNKAETNLSTKKKKEHKTIIKENKVSKRITRNSKKNGLEISLQGEENISGRPSMKMKLELD